MEDRALQEISLNVTPVDIPCVSVGNSEDVGKWTIPQLKFRLKYRRLNQQGLKSVRSRRKVSSIFCFAVCFLPGYVRCVPDSKTYLRAFCIPFCVQSKSIQCNILLLRQGLRS